MSLVLQSHTSPGSWSSTRIRARAALSSASDEKENDDEEDEEDVSSSDSAFRKRRDKVIVVEWSLSDVMNGRRARREWSREKRERERRWGIKGRRKEREARWKREHAESKIQRNVGQQNKMQ